MASGVLHEVVVSVIAIKARLYPEIGLDYVPRYGNQLLFFVWNGVLLLLEHAFGKHPVIQWMVKNLPQPIITCLVLLMVLPMSHLFTDEYLRSGFFTDFSISCPTIVKL